MKLLRTRPRKIKKIAVNIFPEYSLFSDPLYFCLTNINLHQYLSSKNSLMMCSTNKKDVYLMDDGQHSSFCVSCSLFLIRQRMNARIIIKVL